jgi:hypothetical protein
MNEREQRISTLINRLDALTLEANSVTRELQELTELGDQEPDHPYPLSHGDRVIITNTYLGQKGTKGLVVRVTDKQVTLKNEETGRRYTRKYNNVRKVSQQEYER